MASPCPSAMALGAGAAPRPSTVCLIARKCLLAPAWPIPYLPASSRCGQFGAAGCTTCRMSLRAACAGYPTSSPLRLVPADAIGRQRGVRAAVQQSSRAASAKDA